uniref:Cytochrome c oxidase assembly protein COX19 n=1 Tax=Nyssomyia neivai TaxID=330878 RepID=A0A1L8E052_9DIPT
MSSMTFSQKKFTPTAPDKGSFPLDHEGLCKKSMLRYMNCLHEKDDSNADCRIFAREYLECRMQNNLMAREEWNKLGFDEDKQ